MTEEDDEMDDQGTMPLLEHLIELRGRLLICVLVFIALLMGCLVPIFGDYNRSIATIVFLFLHQPLADILHERGGRMIFTAVQEGLLTMQIKMAFFVAFFVAFPIILLQIWRFVAPGLYKAEKQAFMPFLAATPALFFLGGAMLYYFVLPVILQFLLSFEIAGGDQTLPIEIEPRISEYLSLVMRLIFAFGLSFELPVILLLMAKVGLITVQGLVRNRKYAILIAFVVAAILTPPDPASQVMLAVPIILLYEISIIAARVLVKQPDYDDDDDA